MMIDRMEKLGHHGRGELVGQEKLYYIQSDFDRLFYYTLSYVAD
jgi:hypothetical protein